MVVVGDQEAGRVVGPLAVLARGADDAVDGDRFLDLALGDGVEVVRRGVGGDAVGLGEVPDAFVAAGPDAAVALAGGLGGRRVAVFATEPEALLEDGDADPDEGDAVRVPAVDLARKLGPVLEEEGDVGAVGGAVGVGEALRPFREADEDRDVRQRCRAGVAADLEGDLVAPRDGEARLDRKRSVDDEGDRLREGVVPLDVARPAPEEGAAVGDRGDRDLRAGGADPARRRDGAVRPGGRLDLVAGDLPPPFEPLLDARVEVGEGSCRPGRVRPDRLVVVAEFAEGVALDGPEDPVRQDRRRGAAAEGVAADEVVRDPVGRRHLAEVEPRAGGVRPPDVEGRPEAVDVGMAEDRRVPGVGRVVAEGHRRRGLLAVEEAEAALKALEAFRRAAGGTGRATPVPEADLEVMPAGPQVEPGRRLVVPVAAAVLDDDLAVDDEPRLVVDVLEEIAGVALHVDLPPVDPGAVRSPRRRRVRRRLRVEDDRRGLGVVGHVERPFEVAGAESGLPAAWEEDRLDGEGLVGRQDDRRRGRVVPLHVSGPLQEGRAPLGRRRQGDRAVLDDPARRPVDAPERRVADGRRDEVRDREDPFEPRLDAGGRMAVPERFRRAAGVLPVAVVDEGVDGVVEAVEGPAGADGEDALVDREGLRGGRAVELRSGGQSLDDPVGGDDGPELGRKGRDAEAVGKGEGLLGGEEAGRGDGVVAGPGPVGRVDDLREANLVEDALRRLVPLVVPEEEKAARLAGVETRGGHRLLLLAVEVEGAAVGLLGGEGDDDVAPRAEGQELVILEVVVLDPGRRQVEAPSVRLEGRAVVLSEEGARPRDVARADPALDGEALGEGRVEDRPAVDPAVPAEELPLAEAPREGLVVRALAVVAEPRRVAGVLLGHVPDGDVAGRLPDRSVGLRGGMGRVDLAGEFAEEAEAVREGGDADPDEGLAVLVPGVDLAGELGAVLEDETEVFAVRLAVGVREALLALPQTDEEGEVGEGGLAAVARDDEGKALAFGAADREGLVGAVEVGLHVEGPVGLQDEGRREGGLSLGVAAPAVEDAPGRRCRRQGDRGSVEEPGLGVVDRPEGRLVDRRRHAVRDVEVPSEPRGGGEEVLAVGEGGRLPGRYLGVVAEGVVEAEEGPAGAEGADALRDGEDLVGGLAGDDLPGLELFEEAVGRGDLAEGGGRSRDIEVAVALVEPGDAACAGAVDVGEGRRPEVRRRVAPEAVNQLLADVAEAAVVEAVADEEVLRRGEVVGRPLLEEVRLGEGGLEVLLEEPCGARPDRHDRPEERVPGVPGLPGEDVDVRDLRPGRQRPPLAGEEEVLDRLRAGVGDLGEAGDRRRDLVAGEEEVAEPVVRILGPGVVDLDDRRRVVRAEDLVPLEDDVAEGIEGDAEKIALVGEVDRAVDDLEAHRLRPVADLVGGRGDRAVGDRYPGLFPGVDRAVRQGAVLPSPRHAAVVEGDPLEAAVGEMEVLVDEARDAAPVEAAVLEVRAAVGEVREVAVAETPLRAGADRRLPDLRRGGVAVGLAVDDDVPVGRVVGVAEVQRVQDRVPLVAAVHRPVPVAALEGRVAGDVAADAGARRAAPEEDAVVGAGPAQLVLLDDEVVAGADDELVGGVVVEAVFPDRDVLHPVPAVLGVEGAAGEGLARFRDVVPFDEHVAHRGGHEADRAAPDDRAVLDRAVPGDPHVVAAEARLGVAELVRLGDGFRDDRGAEVSRPFRDEDGSVLVGPLGGEEALVGVVEGGRIEPGGGEAPLVAEVFREGDVLVREGGDVAEAEGDPFLRRRVDRPVGHADRARLGRREARHRLAGERAAHPAAAAVAGDVADDEVLDRRVAGVAFDREAVDPFGLVRGVRVVVLVVVALEDAVDEVGVVGVEDLDDRRAAPGELVLLERRAVEIEGHPRGDEEALLVGDAVGAGEEDDLAVALLDRLVEEALEPLDGAEGRRLDRLLVVVRPVDDLATGPGDVGGLAVVVRPDVDAVAVGGDGRRVRRDRLVELALDGVGVVVGEDHREELAVVAVVADPVAREVFLGHLTDLFRGDRDPAGLADAEFVPDGVRVAPFPVGAFDGEGVVADGEAAEARLVVAGGEVAQDDGRLGIAFLPVADRHVEAVGVVAEADEAVVPVGHEEAQDDLLGRRDGRLDVVGGDVGGQLLLRIVEVGRHGDVPCEGQAGGEEKRHRGEDDLLALHVPTFCFVPRATRKMPSSLYALDIIIAREK